MIKVDLTGRNLDIDDSIRAYIDEKIGGLEKYLPRRDRGNVSCTVILTDDPSGREDNRYICEAVMSVNGTQLVSQEGTVSIYAAVDIVEAKLKVQLTRYKEKQTLQPRRSRMLARLMGRKSETPDAEVGTAEQEPVQ
jgi:putative sigma-54 modulation protein